MVFFVAIAHLWKQLRQSYYTCQGCDLIPVKKTVIQDRKAIAYLHSGRRTLSTPSKQAFNFSANTRT